VDDKGRFPWQANTWEVAVLEAEFVKENLIGWLRNQPRRPESLCVPYHAGGEDRACYPDLLIFRQEGAGIVVDLLDPHDPGLPDAAEKAVGLAVYAQHHGELFGRIELVTQVRGELRRLDVNRESIREKVKKVRDRAHLLALYGEFGGAEFTRFGSRAKLGAG
jgi:type III restriction enzyme